MSAYVNTINRDFRLAPRSKFQSVLSYSEVEMFLDTKDNPRHLWLCTSKFRKKANKKQISDVRFSELCLNVCVGSNGKFPG